MSDLFTYLVLHLQDIYSLVCMISKDVKNSLIAAMVDCKNGTQSSPALLAHSVV